MLVRGLVIVDEIGTSVPQSRVLISCIREFEQKGVLYRFSDEIGISIRCLDTVGCILFKKKERYRFGVFSHTR